jgi:hypothetical protein
VDSLFVVLLSLVIVFPDLLRVDAMSGVRDLSAPPSGNIPNASLSRTIGRS